MCRTGIGKKKGNNEDWKIGIYILYLLILKYRILKINLGPYNTTLLPSAWDTRAPTNKNILVTPAILIQDEMLH